MRSASIVEMTSCAAAASSQWRMSAASKPSVFSAVLEVGRRALGRVEVEREEVQVARSATAAGSFARTVPAAALRGLISGLSGCASL